MAGVEIGIMTHPGSKKPTVITPIHDGDNLQQHMSIKSP